MTCEICERDSYFEDEDVTLAGIPLCEGCDLPTDACTCDPLED
jgi:hypothetical protein